MNFTDTHTHIYLEQFDEDREAMITRAFEEGVNRMFLPNIDASTIDSMNALCATYPQQIFPMMGLHPCSVKADYMDELKRVEQELASGKYVAVGEMGIDLYWDKSFLSAQVDAFKVQVDLAKKYDLPIVIHTRDAFDEVFQLMDELHDHRLKGVFHCFTGDDKQMQKALSYAGFYLGVGGVLTFKNAGLDKILSHAPMDRLILETDAPYLTPHPYRGKRNEPAYIPYIAEKLALCHEISISDVAEITTSNSKHLFKC